MKRHLFVPLACSLFAILLACQSAPVIEYVKYDNEQAVPRISAEEAKKAYDAGHVVFVDTRGKGAFDVEHLPGAMVIEYNAPDTEFDKLPKGKKIILYCS
jgi:predicted sulfurtransferase